MFAGFEDIAEESGFTHLHQVVCGLSSACLETELENYPELVDVQDSNGWSPLFWAIYLHDYETTKTLLEYGADRLAIDSYGGNVLHLSCQSPDILRLLLRSWSNSSEEMEPIHLSNQKNKYMMTP